MSEPAILNSESKSGAGTGVAAAAGPVTSSLATGTGNSISHAIGNGNSTATEPFMDGSNSHANTNTAGPGLSNVSTPAQHSFIGGNNSNSMSMGFTTTVLGHGHGHAHVHGHSHSHSTSSSSSTSTSAGRLMVPSMSMVSPGGGRYSLAKMIDASEARMLRLKKLDEFVEDKMEKLSAKIRSDASEGFGQIAVDISDWLDPVYLLVADAFRKQGFRVHFEDKEGVPTDDDDPCGCKMLIDWDTEGNNEMRVEEETGQLPWNEEDMEPQHKR